MRLIEVRNNYELLVGILLAFTDKSSVIAVVGDSANLGVVEKLSRSLCMVTIPYKYPGVLGKVLFRVFGCRRILRDFNFDELIVFHDSSPLVSLLKGKARISLYEHGLINYFSNSDIYNSLSFPSKVVALLNGGRCCGRMTAIESVYLKRPDLSPADLVSKVKKLDMYFLWEELSGKEKGEVSDAFGVVGNFAEYSDGISVVVTQNISELGAVTELEKIEIYRDLLVSTNSYTQWIKPHPLETTDYKAFFPGITVIPSEVPLELFFLINNSICEVKTLFSSVVISCPENIKIDWRGTKDYKKLREFFGDCQIPVDVNR